MNPRRRWAWIGLAAVALLPCLAVVHCIYWYAGRLPLEDGWYTPGRLLDAALDGTLHWDQFFAQHNEARKAFSSCVWLLLALGGWDGRIEMYASVLLVATCVVSYLFLCLKYEPRSKPAPMLLAAIASILLFNPIGLVGAHPAWLWGVNLENAIVVAALFGGICANSRLSSMPLRYAISVACSVAATYSFASGMLLWVLLYPRWFGPGGSGPKAPAPRGMALDAVYMALFATVVVTYFIGFERPENRPTLMHALGRPKRFFEFFFAWLGAPLAPLPLRLSNAGVVGGVGVALFVWGFVQVARQRIWTRALPYLLLAMFTLASALAVSIGRSPFGASNAMASRYCLHVLAFYLALNGLLWLCSTAERGGRRSRASRFVLWTALALQVTVLAYNWVGIHPKHVRHFEVRNARGEAAAQFVELIPDNPDLNNLHEWMPELVPRFKRLARGGVLDVELVPGREELELASEEVDQSAALFLSTDGERLRISGAVVGDSANERFTHLLLRSSAGGREKFVSVLPLSVFPLAGDTEQRPIDALISTRNLPEGSQTLELLGFELATRVGVPLGVATHLRHGRISQAEILDAQAQELQQQPGIVCVDAVNGVGAQGGTELTLSRGPLVFTGWAMDSRTNELASRVFVMVGGRLIPAYTGQRRPDVAQSFGRPELSACGFTCTLDESLVAGDTSGHFQFVIETRGGEFLLEPRGLSIQRVER